MNMNPTQTIILSATVLAALGTWLMLPRGGARGRLLGMVLGLAALGLFGSRISWLGDWASQSVFGLLAGVTLISAVGAVTMRSPVYCAIWFALTLLGTAGLLLVQGAQFLGVATVVVYAGAILVTFLFVLMLAQPRGQDYYDRLSWEAQLSAVAGAVLVGTLTMTTAAVFQTHGRPPIAPLEAQATTDELAAGILHAAHVENLGARLFTTHLIAVEVAGALLLVALVGAVAIAAQGKMAQAAPPAVDPIASRRGSKHG